MVRYELIKKYPGSPELGYVSLPKTEENKKTNNHYYSGSWFDPSLFPEFWKKVEQVDYEILSFSLKCNGNILKKHSNKLFGVYNGEFSEEDILSGDPKRISWNFSIEETNDTYGYIIHSVKRLIDGEVFTIGDVLKYKSFGRKRLIIERFEISENRVMIYANNYGTQLIGAEKLHKKAPLFTTEDGVEIFEGENIYPVELKWFKVHLNVKAPNYIKSSKFKIFSTLEKAEEYIILNKPVLSLNDLLSVWGNAESPKETPLFLRFKKIAKSKL